jgi:hypothetical protein
LRLLLDSSRLLFRFPWWTASLQPPRGVAELSPVVGTVCIENWGHMVLSPARVFGVFRYTVPGYVPNGFDTLSPNSGTYGALSRRGRAVPVPASCQGLSGYPFATEPRDGISLGFGDSGGVRIPGTCHRVREGKGRYLPCQGVFSGPRPLRPFIAPADRLHRGFRV